MKLTSFDEFKELAQRGTFVPVCKEIVADLLTPVSAFLKIAEHSDYAFLLESVEGGEHVGRYSFLGKDPFLILRARDGKTIDRARRRRDREPTEPFIDDAARADGRLPVAVRAGAAALHRRRRRIPRLRRGRLVRAGAAAADDEPDGRDDEAGFMLFDTVLAFDHVQHRILIIANARITGDDDLESLYQFACAKIEFLERELERDAVDARRRRRRAARRSRRTCTREQFEQMVRTAKEHIAAGDIYQVVLSQRFEADDRRRPVHGVSRAAARESVAVHVFPPDGRLSIVGSSPEMLVRVEGRHVETHPIAGTRPRGRNDEEDCASPRS